MTPVIVRTSTAKIVRRYKQVFSDNEGAPFAADPAKGWDLVIDRICAREAEIEAGIDGQTIRKILERLATKAR
ncbi:MAG TPA: hypothetical protein VKG86_07575, partial [Terracidiphilus sp.]|nr:hypothetical protein [Terracidiphilus sp.]